MDYELALLLDSVIGGVEVVEFTNNSYASLTSDMAVLAGLMPRHLPFHPPRRD